MIYILLFAWIAITVFLVYFYFPIISSYVNYQFKKGQDSHEVSDNSSNTEGGDSSDVETQTGERILENKIIISKINISAPIVEPASINDKDILKALEGGIVHYSNTANPGEVGNSFFTGHSSNYRWAKGNHNYIFALLNKLESGDLVVVHFEGKKYVYQVFENVVVSSKDVSVLDQTDESIISLMTCDPPGTSWKRRVVKGRQVEPDPEINKGSDSKNSDGVNELIGN